MEVVLYQPEIPQNTGSIARTCAATGTPLHLVGKLGFEIDEKKVRRAGLDYWPYVNLTLHDSWENYIGANQPKRVWLFSRFAERIYYEADFAIGDALVFGSETQGLPKDFTAGFDSENILRIPIACHNVRSLNLSNAVSIAVYEARRQLRLDSVNSSSVKNIAD